MRDMKLDMIHGDTDSWLLTFSRDNSPVNLVDSFITFTARLAPDSVDPPLIKHDTTDGQLSILSPTDGTAVLTLLSEDTAELSLKNKTVLYYDVELIEADGTSSTPIIGTLTVSPNVTH